MGANRKQRLTLLLLVLIALTLVFIWGNSLLDREASTEVSTGLLDFLYPFLEAIGIRPEDDHWLRKLAHFCEFGLLGVELALLAFVRVGGGIKAYSIAAAAAFFVAAADETIQRFTGRACRFSDVMLDFSGAICGIAGICLIVWIFRRAMSGKT